MAAGRMLIKSNAKQLASAWEKRAKALAPLMREATEEATKEYYAESRKQMKELIYDKPVPTRAQLQAERKGRTEGRGKTFRPRKNFMMKRGTVNTEGSKPAWKRTGNLKRSEHQRLQSAYVGIVVNDANYGKPRHEMGKPGHRGTRYPAPWRDKAADVKRAAIREIYRNHLKKAIRTGIISGPTAVK